MKLLELGRVKLAKRPSVLCRAVGSFGSLVPSGGQVGDPVDVGQLDPDPRPAEFQVDLYVEASKLSRTAKVSVGRSLGWARQPTVRRPPPWDSSSQGPRIHSNWPAAAGRSRAGAGPVTAVAAPVAARARLATSGGRRLAAHLRSGGGYMGACASATWSAAWASRSPSGCSGPAVVSLAVCSSISAFSSAPTRTTKAVRYSQNIKMMIPARAP